MASCRRTEAGPAGRWRGAVLPLLALLLAEVLLRASGLQSEGVARPSEILVAGWDSLREGHLLRATAQTLACALAGLLLGGGAGLLGGLALGLSAPLYVVSALWLGPAASTVQDLVLPRLRAVASAGFLLTVTLVGLALGPYVVGRLSVATGDLRVALSLGLVANGLGAACLWLASRGLPAAEATLHERARAAGESC